MNNKMRSTSLAKTIVAAGRLVAVGTAITTGTTTLASTSSVRGAGVSLEFVNSEIQSAVGPEHCVVNQTATSFEFQTSPAPVHAVPVAIELRSAIATNPDTTVTVYSSSFDGDFCASSIDPKARATSGKQRLVVDRSQPNPRYSLTTTLQCSNGKVAFERKFVVKCDLNF